MIIAEKKSCLCEVYCANFQIVVWVPDSNWISDANNSPGQPNPKKAGKSCIILVVVTLPVRPVFYNLVLHYSAQHHNTITVYRPVLCSIRYYCFNI